ncbi:MAG: flagella basal body P-ring formation protein FlgA [Phenylobacterium zucineum]|nr:MAG: flagella basal body P-ring formation protein FlgA [Phenylobacterium zucineum]
MRHVLIAFCITLVAAQAFAGQVVNLKPQIIDTDGVITLDEIFDHTGSAGQIAVAQREGRTTVLDALLVQTLARRHGLDWANDDGLRRIIVSSRDVAAPKSNIDILTYARNLSAGDMVQPQDLVWTKGAAAPGDAVSDADQLIGMVARRPLKMGSAAARHDVSAQVVIKPGDLVTVTYQADGISLSLQAKATNAAAVGEPVDVQNTLSKKVIQAVASGPGQVVVGAQADQIRAAARTQIALR